MMSNEFNKDDAFWVETILLFSENDVREWEELRDISLKKIPRKKYRAYFGKLLKNEIKSFILPTGTQLFRARPIKNHEWTKTGINAFTIQDDIFSTLLSPDELERISNSKIPITPLQFFRLKCSQMDEFSEDDIARIALFYEKLQSYSKSDFYGFDKYGCGVPPRKYRSAQRLSTKRDPFLYLAMEKDTAICEMRPIKRQNFSLGKCITERELRLANLCEVEAYNDGSNFTLSSILSSISEPNTDNESGFYHITQYLSHLIKKCGYDGIIYKSAVSTDGKNVMLFDESGISFIASDIITILEVPVKPLTLFPFTIGDEEPHEQ